MPKFVRNNVGTAWDCGTILLMKGPDERDFVPITISVPTEVRDWLRLHPPGFARRVLEAAMLLEGAGSDAATVTAMELSRRKKRL